MATFQPVSVMGLHIALIGSIMSVGSLHILYENVMAKCFLSAGIGLLIIGFLVFVAGCIGWAMETAKAMRRSQNCRVHE